ncbi:hypothetical protein [Pseudoduganella violacea]|uniref:Uncharacterized protein n=1 Tax=Pseudoduganella violacea TaxID=1715466 RepID=A0A7W5B967_9BURK|nr:hypothetical protein [Pseudoduganella violacea]MBB3118877.1 hypothetical protein [Pseudoduganella violacea]
MFNLRTQPEAAADLLSMVKQGGASATHAMRIAAMIDEVKKSEELLNNLHTESFSVDDFEVGKYLEFWNDGIDLWKIKPFNFDELHKKWHSIPYRILYAYDIQCTTFRILGIVPRSFNYDANHALTKRIIKTYIDLGLPRHKVIKPTKRINK